MMRLHSELHNIEFIYRGFGSTLNEFEKKLNTLNSNFVMAIEKNSIEDYNDINLKILSMKNDLDSSEIMANFNKHRTQVAIDNFVNDSVKIKISNINFNSLLVEAKESIMQELKKEKNVKLEKECKINVEKLKTDLNKQAVEIKKQKEEIAKQTNQINLQNAQINKQTNRISEQQKKIFFKIVILLIFVLRV